MSRKTRYAAIRHPAVGVVACPYCRSPLGVPCRANQGKRVGFGHPRRYCETHLARVRAADRLTRVTGRVPVERLA